MAHKFRLFCTKTMNSYIVTGGWHKQAINRLAHALGLDGVDVYDGDPPIIDICYDRYSDPFMPHKTYVSGIVWNVDGDDFVHMFELSEEDRKNIEGILYKYETDGESFPLIREE